MTSLATYTYDDPIATITMDDGKVNVLSPQMLAELNDGLDRAEADNAVVLLTGRTGVFSAGFDLRVLSAGGLDAKHMVRNGFELGLRILSFPLPVAIACSGHALAMASFLLLSGDYRVGASGDFKIQANEVAIGMTMPDFAIEICRQRLTPAGLNRAVNNAEPFTPEGAVAVGFLDRVVPANQLSDSARDTALELSKLNLNAHAAAKQRLRAGTLATLRAALESDDRAFPVGD
ncbi:MAG: crotonase/enoyl-CoA hydratase family protein [Actinobacteria bacterium]|nr:crotonase/enoyl-CoA hydratase family protein [Actinomycetota bacterium]